MPRSFHGLPSRLLAGSVTSPEVFRCRGVTVSGQHERAADSLGSECRPRPERSQLDNSMKSQSLKHSLRNLVRTSTRTLLLTVAGLVLFGATQVKAAEIVMETKVPGYSKAGWVLVVPELRARLGGAVVFDALRNRYVTDRISRGDEVQLTILPTNIRESVTFWGGRPLSWIGLTYTGNLTELTLQRLPSKFTFHVSNDPAFDEARLFVSNRVGSCEKRVPIGSR